MNGANAEAVDTGASTRRLPLVLAALPLVVLSAIGIGLGAIVLRGAAAQDLGPLVERPVGVGLCLIACGGTLAGLALAFLRLSGRVSEIAKSRDELQRSQDQALRQSRQYRTQVEALSLMREIHRAGNITSADERLRQILSALAASTAARDVTLYAMDAETHEPRAAAVFRSDDRETLFALLRPGAAAPNSRQWHRGIQSRCAAAQRLDRTLSIQGDMYRREERVGRAWLNLSYDGRPALLSQDPADLLDASLQRTDIDCGQAVEAFRHQRLFRRVEARERCLELTMPLHAEQQLIGAMRLRMGSEAGGGEQAEWLEGALVEASRHIGLALKKEQDSIEAITDGLTGLFIKRHFLNELARMLREHKENGRPISLLMVDIDHFKVVNDTYGHLTGDRILKGVAACLTKSLRSDDTAFRYGGEEMAILLPGAPVETARQAAERLRERVKACTFKAEDGRDVTVTISLGVAGMDGEVPTIEDLISRADLALYASKHNGRDRATIYSPELAAAKA